MAGITDNAKAKIPTGAEFMLSQSTDEDCHSAFSSVGKAITRLASIAIECLFDYPLQVAHYSRSSLLLCVPVSIIFATIFFGQSSWKTLNVRLLQKRVVLASNGQ